MKVLITGISGFIGQYLAVRLQSEGYEVFGLYEHEGSREKNPTIDEGHAYVASLTDFTEIEDIVADIKPDFVIHLAAKTEVALSFDNYLEVSEVNYLGTLNLSEANRKYNPGLKLFLMASTMETYGHQDPDNGPFTEETPQHPMAPYAVAKLACERYLEYMQYAYGFPYSILRQTNAYGRTDNDFFIMERIITQMLDGDEIFLGDPRPVRNFIWIEDLIDLYVTMLDQPDAAQGEIFVVGPDNGLRIDDLVDMIAAKLEWEGKVHWHQRKDGLPDLPGEIFYLNSKADKARDVLGWKPAVGLSEGIDKTIAIWTDVS